MAQRLVSIYMTNEVIKICEARKNGNSVSAINAFEVEMPSNCFNDGMIMDVDALADTIKSNMSMNGIKKGKLVFTISSKKIGNKEIVIPFVRNRAKIGEIINANLSEYFPMNNMEDYVCRYTVLDTFENAEGKHYSVSITAVQKDMINLYFELAEALKMPIESVDYYGNSIYNILQKQLTVGIVLALQMDKDVTYVNIMKGKAQLFRRSIPFGKDTLVKNLALMNDITNQEALAILEDPQKLDASVSVEQYSELIADFTASIMRVVEFHVSRNPGIVIELGKLMGEGAGIVGLTEVLSKELGVPVTYVKQPNGLKIKKSKTSDLNYEKAAAYLPNVGAVMNSLNLKIESEKKKSTLGDYGVFYLLIVFSAIAVVGVSVYLILQYKELEKQKDYLNGEIAKRADAELIFLDYSNAKNAFDAVSAYDASTHNDTEALYDWILLLEQKIPEGIGISNMSVADGDVAIVATATEKQGISLFISELKEMPNVSYVFLQTASDVKDEEGNTTTTFNMSIHINPEQVTEVTGEPATGTEEAKEGE